MFLGGLQLPLLSGNLQIPEYLLIFPALNFFQNPPAAVFFTTCVHFYCVGTPGMYQLHFFLHQHVSPQEFRKNSIFYLFMR